MRGEKWTREEMILAFNLYLKLPFGKMHKGTPEIIELANLMGRTVNSVTLRLVNYASCDPYHQQRGVKGMVGGMKQCQPIWDEFANNRDALLFESERILAEKEHQTIEIKFNELLFDIQNLKGETKIREVKTRVNQNVFRQIVLANYNKQCAITGIDIPDLLFASHIIPWAANEQERLNPENGICLSALYDKAFDKGLIGINANYEIMLSIALQKNKNKDYFIKYFAPIEKVKLQMPQKYLPKAEFLEWHRDMVFEKREKMSNFAV
jgi:putative restriction endonuclease